VQAETRPLLSFMQAGNDHKKACVSKEQATRRRRQPQLNGIVASAERNQRRSVTVNVQVDLLAARVFHGALVVRVIARLAREALLVRHGVARRSKVMDDKLSLRLAQRPFSMQLFIQSRSEKTTRFAQSARTRCATFFRAE
jgi:hypothetical protein